MAADRAAELTQIQTRMVAIAGGAVTLAALAFVVGGPIRDLIWPAEEEAVAPPAQGFGFLSALTGEVVVIDRAGQRRVVRQGETVELRDGMRVITGEGAVADVRVGDGVRMTLLSGTDINFERVRVTQGGRTDVRARLDSGTVLASARRGEAATTLQIATTEGVVTASEADFLVRVGGEGLDVEVIRGEVRVRTATGDVFRLRSGERLTIRRGVALREVLTQEELSILETLSPHLASRVLDMEQPTDAPTERTKEDHEEFLRGLILQAAEWFVDDEAKAVLAWITEPFRIGRERYTKRLMTAYLDDLLYMHDVKRVEIDEDAMEFEWTIDPRFARAVVEFDGYAEVVDVQATLDAIEALGDPTHSTPTEGDECLIPLEFRAILVFEWRNRRWRAAELDIDFEVVEGPGAAITPGAAGGAGRP